MAARLRLTFLVDNRAGRSGLIAEHGLSVLVETEDARILFDTGQGAALAPNAEALGADLGNVHALVFSHGHYDHTGGLAAALQRNRLARLYLHPAAAAPKYARSQAPPHREIGMPAPCREALRTAMERVVWNRNAVEIAPGVTATGEIPRPAAAEAGRFFLDPSCQRPDPFVDEQALMIETPRGLVVLTGCAHAGLPATLGWCRRLSGGRRVFAVFGGFHLAAATDQELESAAEALESSGAEVIGPCHCTGARGYGFLRSRFGGRVIEPECGFVWEYSERERGAAGGLAASAPEVEQE